MPAPRTPTRPSATPRWRTETIAFLEAVVPTPASIIGWSDGAVVGALVAMQRPDLVARLVLIGQFYDLSGAANPGLTAALTAMRDDPPAVLRGNYDALSPDGPEHFPAVFAKTIDMLVSEPTIPMADLAAITAPTLVLQGDRDEVRLSHSVEVVATLPDARLAVLPGTHALPLESPALVNALLLDFLAARLARPRLVAGARGRSLRRQPRRAGLSSPGAEAWRGTDISRNRSIAGRRFSP